MSSWVVVIDLVKFELHVHGIGFLTSLVERVLNMMGMSLLEVFGVEVISKLNEVDVGIVLVVLESVWFPDTACKSESSI